MIAGVFAGGWRVQLQSMRGNPDWFLTLFLAPLQTAVFTLIFMHAQRGDLTAYAVLAPSLIALFLMALQTSGELISRERENGSLEGLLAAPGRFEAMLLGRISAVTALSLLAFVESWVVAWFITGQPVAIERPGLFAVTLAITALSMNGWALVMAAVFVLARSARTFQNSLSYPFLVLGGVLVPVSLLPEPVQVLSRSVFLSWSADLLRQSLGAAPAGSLGGQFVALGLLGLTGYAVGHLLVHRALRRVRTTGSLTYA